MRLFLSALVRAVGATRVGRLVIVLLAAAAAGLINDWLRTDQRLLFPRPLPVFLLQEPYR